LQLVLLQLSSCRIFQAGPSSLVFILASHQTVLTMLTSIQGVIVKDRSMLVGLAFTEIFHFYVRIIFISKESCVTCSNSLIFFCPTSWASVLSVEYKSFELKSLYRHLAMNTYLEIMS
jgi:hypothetical protein